MNSLTQYFAVPKGDSDIRVVYDASVSGINALLWDPGFRLPTLSALLHKIYPFSFQLDKDVGEMFHNHTLHTKIRQYAGVDLTPYIPKPDKKRGPHWQRWVKCGMGLMGYPHQALHTTRHIE